MGSQSDPTPLIVVVGETASGKSALAMEIAQKWDGEIIAADSRTVYKGMDIGTAKPTANDRKEIPHHLIDIAEPSAPVTAADFKRLAIAAINDTAQRGKLPVMVGGSGLYIDAVIFDYTFAPMPHPAERAALQNLSVAELQQKLRAANIPLPSNYQNKRHLIRQVETGGITALPRKLRPNTLVIGVYREREDITHRIERRVEMMLAAGLEAEVRVLFARYGMGSPPLLTIGYQEFRDYFEGSTTLDAVRASIIKNTLQYAKRQRTWFRRNPAIHWICNTEEAEDLITTFLNK